MSEALRSSIYWDEATKKRAEELAQADRRSVSNLICTLIDQEYLRRQHPRQLIDSGEPYCVDEV